MVSIIALIAAMSLPATSSGFTNRMEAGAPHKVLESGLVGMLYEAFVAPDGTIEGCTVRLAVGDQQAAQTVCDRFLGKRAQPATGPDGQPIYGYVRGSLIFADNVSGIPADADAPDLSISVKGMDVDSARVGLTVLVGADGNVMACEPEAAQANLGQAACAQLREITLPVRQSKAGAKVSYLYPVVVEFQRDRG